MLKNYFKIAWRNLVKNKAFSVINITGLASGLACFILIALYVADELSYDRFNEKANRIYRVNTDIVFGGTNLHMATTCDPMGATLKRDYPQVEEYVRFYNSNGSKLVKKGNEFINENNVVHADSTLFDVFTLPAVGGNTKTALNEPNTVVINASTAMKYFGTTDAVGKTIETNENNSTLYKVTAVIKDIPHNAHFNFDFIFSMDNVQYDFGNYLSCNHQTYIVLKEGTDYKVFEKNFAQVAEKYVLPQASQFLNISSLADFKKAGNKLEYTLMPLTDIHLHSDRSPELGINGSVEYVYIFSAVAFFVLLLACVNFMNLSTARSAGRAKEVGMRKVMGTQRKALIGQFLTESVLMTFVSLLIALVIAAFCMQYFNALSGKSLAITDLLRPGYLTFLILLPLAVGVVAGGYPAFYLSGFKPITVLKGKMNAGVKKSGLRNALVVIQFSTSIILIVGTMVVYRQLNYIQTKKLGFNKDQLLIVNGTGSLGKNSEVFKNEVAKITGVNGASSAGFLPVSNSSRSDFTYSKSAVMDSKSGLNMQTWRIDYDYIKTMGMEIIQGRNFSKDFGADSGAVIINESTAALLGYKDPIGNKIYSYGEGQFSKQLFAYNIIGVVKNFHYESLRQTVAPLCFRLGDAGWATAFKVSTADVKGLVANIETEWKKLSPAMPFSYQFLDDSFNEMYKVEQRTGKLGLSLSIVAILIACLGLFGLATYMAEQRTKEMGVRKVLGATTESLVKLLSADFLRLVLIALIVAVPVAWTLMHFWLKDFAFRINMPWWVFVAAGLSAMLIALLTVSYQSIKAALTNPVKSLRSE
ncbi:ABC transporter permease [Ferruginibacter paludis]|uniref:ABC transporter permease n=1 Tax=Ferruginibacter paludis TaxID=1310417 RepID=UPI0025B32DB5|nr:ABC transporter permease [Ferruginibacter paludis]MDN3655923.1 ABC transporter permease [Ferruginibacter paludis]